VAHKRVKKLFILDDNKAATIAASSPTPRW
jgi:hypothetical protein